MKNILRTFFLFGLVLFLASGCVRNGRRWQEPSPGAATPTPAAATADSASLPPENSAQTPTPEEADDFWQAWETLASDWDEWLANPAPVSTEEIP
jgi:hypothetical protein